MSGGDIGLAAPKNCVDHWAGVLGDTLGLPPPPLEMGSALGQQGWGRHWACPKAAGEPRAAIEADEAQKPDAASEADAAGELDASWIADAAGELNTPDRAPMLPARGEGFGDAIGFAPPKKLGS